MQQKQIIREGKYKKDQQRFQIGKYAAENGTAVLVRKYRPNFSKINESTIREFKRKYEVQLRHSKNNAGHEAAQGLMAEKSGRPLILGKLDVMVQTYIRSASNRGAVVTRSTAVATAKALRIRHPDRVGKIDLDNSEWAKSLCRRMGYTRRKATALACARKLNVSFIIRLWKELKPTKFLIHWSLISIKHLQNMFWYQPQP